jgi:hypothetical protein
VAQEADGRSRGFGTVLFATLEDGKRAIGKKQRLCTALFVINNAFCM